MPCGALFDLVLMYTGEFFIMAFGEYYRRGILPSVKGYSLRPPSYFSSGDEVISWVNVSIGMSRMMYIICAYNTVR